MRKHILRFTAAIFVVNGMTDSRIFGQSNLENRQPGANTAVDRAAGAAAGAIADNGVREQSTVRDALSRAVAATLSENLSTLSTVMNEDDKRRLGEKLNQPNAQMAEQIAHFRQAWRTKYNQQFDLRSGEIAFGSRGLRLTPGNPSIDASARVVSDRLGAGSGMVTPARDAAATPSDSTGGAARGSTPAVDRADASTDTGTLSNAAGNAEQQASNAVTAILPSSGHMPEVRVSLVRQALGDDWKIDLPDGVDAAQLQANVQRQLSLLLTDPQNWPADVKDGYRMAAQRALSALVTPNATSTGAAATPAK
jgi:hypothetical protein